MSVEKKVIQKSQCTYMYDMYNNHLNVIYEHPYPSTLYPQTVAGFAGKPRVFSNPLGLAGHDPCVSEAGLEPVLGGEARVGQCYNELECVASGGLAAGYCPDGPGSNILVSPV